MSMSSSPANESDASVSPIRPYRRLRRRRPIDRPSEQRPLGSVCLPGSHHLHVDELKGGGYPLLLDKGRSIGGAAEPRGPGEGYSDVIVWLAETA
jgi:hypothetical protein